MEGSRIRLEFNKQLARRSQGQYVLKDSLVGLLIDRTLPNLTKHSLPALYGASYPEVGTRSEYVAHGVTLL